MRRDFRMAPINSRTYRLWHADYPGAGWLITSSGACTCEPPRFSSCEHYKLLTDFLRPPGLPLEQAKTAARRILDNFTEDGLMRTIKIRKPEISKGRVYHLIMDITYRGKGVQSILETRHHDMNVKAVIKFQQNTEKEYTYLALLHSDRVRLWKPLDF